MKVTKPKRKWHYKVTRPMLPADSIAPVMTHFNIEDWLNDMDAQGWEFVGYGQKNWATKLVDFS
jgi:hypothetical protein